MSAQEQGDEQGDAATQHLISASGIDRALTCPASVVLPKDSRAAVAATDRGTVIHAFFEEAAALGREAALARVPEEYRAICEAIDLSDVPVSTIKFAAEVAVGWDVTTRTAREIGRGIGRNYGITALSEIVGTADVMGLSADGLRVFVFDYKTGRTQLTRAAKNWQLRTLAFIACRLWGAIDAIVGLIHAPAYKGDDEGEPLEIRPHYDSAYLDAWEIDSTEPELASGMGEWLKAREALAQGMEPRAVTGGHCQWCDAMPHCRAATAMIRTFVSDLGAAEETLVPTSPETAAQAWMTIDALEAVIRPAKKALMAYAARTAFALPNGLVVGEVTERGRPTYDGGIVRQELGRLYGPDVAEAACEFTSNASAIERALKPHAKQLGSALAPIKRQALKAIEDAGGVLREVKTRVKPHVPTAIARDEIRALEVAMAESHSEAP